MAKAFEGKVVLVTGANSGIGEAIAVAFQEAGATVSGLGRRQEALEAARARHPVEGPVCRALVSTARAYLLRLGDVGAKPTNVGMRTAY